LLPETNFVKPFGEFKVCGSQETSPNLENDKLWFGTCYLEKLYTTYGARPKSLPNY